MSTSADDRCLLAPPQHPARLFGQELRRLRRAGGGPVARLFAGCLGLTPARYSEIEAGVIGDFTDEMLTKAGTELALSREQATSLGGLLREARVLPPLRMKDVFTREELTPLFPPTRRSTGERMTSQEVDALVDRVFASE